MLNELKKDKIRLLLYLIIVLEIIILMCLTVYRVNEFKNNNKEVINIFLTLNLFIIPTSRKNS